MKSEKVKIDKVFNLVDFWWGKVDSNHRSRRQQIYSLPPLATREFPHIQFAFEKVGAGRRTRTPDLLITNQLLYQLSYTGDSNSKLIIARFFGLSTLFLYFLMKFCKDSVNLGLSSLFLSENYDIIPMYVNKLVFFAMNLR